MNPFLLPGFDSGDPGLPLCPWHPPTSEHRKYYVDVGGAAGEYRRFLQVVGDGRSLVSHGRLVLVLGETGCGKTSMVNRCAYWLRRQLGRNGVDTRILSFQKKLDSTPVDERIQMVAERFADLMDDEDVLRSNTAVADVHDRVDKPALMYGRASDSLRQNCALLFLPPPITLIEMQEKQLGEIHRYAEFVNPGIVFFLEVTLPGPGVTLPPIARGATPIQLTLHTLSGEDSIRFGARRLKRNGVPGDYPMMSASTLHSIVADAKKPKTIRFLQVILHNLYEERRANRDRYTKHDEVSDEDFHRYVYANLVNQDLGG